MRGDAGKAEARARTRRPQHQKVPKKTVVVGWNPKVFRGCQERVARTGRVATTREVVHYLCEFYLPRLVTGLRVLGFTGEEIGPRRPRQVNAADWDALLRASEETGLPASELLRACLHCLYETPTNHPAPPEEGQ
jgi:hypothetical protein